jgi:F-type H+-transporting ATPase subunit b
MKRYREMFLGICLAVLFFAGMAQAAQEGGSAAQHVMETSIFKWFHFLILAALAYWVFGRLLPPKFRSKADSISSAISKATAAKAEAERLLKEAETKLAALEKEVAQLRAQAQKDVAAELERLRAVTKADAEKIAAAAKAEIEAAERAARLELKVLAAQVAVDRAESLVAKELTPVLHESVLTDFVQRLQGRPN